MSLCRVYESALEIVGNTPLVRLHAIEKSEKLQCQLYAKCEFFNVGGSVKDRIGIRMVMDAEKSGRIKPGDTLIEPTSGNTGIGLAIASAIKGYRCIITMPEKMSEEKVNVLKALGAEIIRTPTEAAFDSPESHIGVAKRMLTEIPNSHILDQYSNPSNPNAHYDGTAEEILLALDNHVDMVVCGVGTGGTITGIARKMKEKLGTKVRIVGADPCGSILALPESLNDEGVHSYHVEGIGYDFIPNVLDRSLVDEWIKTNDDDSFKLSRRLIREEGLLCGGSSGSALFAALKAARSLKDGQKCVVVLPDSIRNYMSKFVSDKWMNSKGFLSEKDTIEKETWASLPVSVLNLQTPVTVSPEITCSEAVKIMNDCSIDQIPVISGDGQILGIVSEGNLTALLVSKRVNASDSVSKALFKQFQEVSPNTPLRELYKMFLFEHFVLVTSKQRQHVSYGQIIERTAIVGVVTNIDLLNYIISMGTSMK